MNLVIGFVSAFKHCSVVNLVYFQQWQFCLFVNLVIYLCFLLRVRLRFFFLCFLEFIQAHLGDKIGEL